MVAQRTLPRTCKPIREFALRDQCSAALHASSMATRSTPTSKECTAQTATVSKVALRPQIANICKHNLSIILDLPIASPGPHCRINSTKGNSSQVQTAGIDVAESKCWGKDPSSFAAT